MLTSITVHSSVLERQFVNFFEMHSILSSVYFLQVEYTLLAFLACCTDRDYQTFEVEEHSQAFVFLSHSLAPKTKTCKCTRGTEALEYS